MSQLDPLGPLDFDYERFPGVALRATDQALDGFALIDRPKQVLELGVRIFDLIKHISAVLAGHPWKGNSVSRALAEYRLKALGAALNVLERLLPPDGFAQPLFDVAARELGDAASAGFDSLLQLLLLLLDEQAGPTSLQWYADLFTRGGVIPAPQAVRDFLNPKRDRNQIFASWWVQGNNPLCVSAVTLDQIRRAVGRLDERKYALVMRGDTLRAANAERRLFWVDFPTLLAGLEVGDYPVSKRLPKPYVLFAVKPTRPDDEPFVPLAISEETKMGPRLVWSDVAKPHAKDDWTRAMLASLCANQLHHTFFSHFPRTHFVMEAVAVATLRALTPRHRLFWLLRTHIDGTLGFNQTALSSFTSQAGADRFLMAASLRTGQALMCASLDGWKHFDFKQDIARRQVQSARLPYYPYRDDAQLWWEAIGAFVSDVVDAAYPSDAAVKGDGHLQRWARVLAGKRTRAANGAELISAAPGTKAQLRDLLRQIVFTCTAYHATVQIPLNGFDVSPLTAPGSLYPDGGDDSPESMLADLGTSLFQLAFFYFGDIVTYEVGTYAATVPASMQPAVQRFAAEIEHIAARVRDSNITKRRKVGAYETLLPEKVSRSVDI